MTQTLSFKAEHGYSADAAITVPVRLRFGTEAAVLDAYVDTGSTFCIFKRGHAEMLGVDVEAGTLLRVATVTGSFEAYGHQVTLETLGYSFDVMVYFAADQTFSRNIMGRRGWLDQVRLGIVEHDAKLYLSRYDE